MKNCEDFFKSPSAQGFLRELRFEFQKSQISAEQVIFDEVEMQSQTAKHNRHENRFPY